MDLVLPLASRGPAARHGAALMAPDYAHWHGMFEVAERFYQGLIPQTIEICNHAGDQQKADEVRKVVGGILKRPEHAWRDWSNLLKKKP
jgi:hydroxylamine dehydrogenase